MIFKESKYLYYLFFIVNYLYYFLKTYLCFRKILNQIFNKKKSTKNLSTGIIGRIFSFNFVTGSMKIIFKNIFLFS